MSKLNPVASIITKSGIKISVIKDKFHAKDIVSYAQSGNDVIVKTNEKQIVINCDTKEEADRTFQSIVDMQNEYNLLNGQS